MSANGAVVRRNRKTNEYSITRQCFTGEVLESTYFLPMLFYVYRPSLGGSRSFTLDDTHFTSLIMQSGEHHAMVTWPLEQLTTSGRFGSVNADGNSQSKSSIDPFR
ncbi:unnamed protein product [Soboliphyme baturini]|uniref:Uncharacterized protein n=1 Tax=Soboliphyme baturini TaxID=241478 RepID=A0A183IJS2_9BILA|nr:unnamed protein product [Soboliphyme baturini]